MGCRQEDVVSALNGIVRGSAYVTPSHNNWVVVYDDASEGDPEEVTRITEELSDKLKSPVIGTVVNDDDLFMNWIFLQGEPLSQFCSDRTMYTGMPDEHWAVFAGDKETLKSYCLAKTVSSDIDLFFSRTETAEDKREFVLESFRSELLARLLGIEAELMVLGYQTVAEERDHSLRSVMKEWKLVEGPPGRASEIRLMGIVSRFEKKKLKAHFDSFSDRVKETTRVFCDYALLFNSECAEWLLQEGIDFNIYPSLDIPIISACKYGSVELINDLVVSHGQDVNAVGDLGESPLIVWSSPRKQYQFGCVKSVKIHIQGGRGNEAKKVRRGADSIRVASG
jgi:hypothetical protein